MTNEQIDQLQALAGGSALSNTHPANLATAVTLIAGAVVELARLVWPVQFAGNDVHLVDTSVVVDGKVVGVELPDADAGNVLPVDGAAPGAAATSTGQPATSTTSGDQAAAAPTLREKLLAKVGTLDLPIAPAIKKVIDVFTDDELEALRAIGAALSPVQSEAVEELLGSIDFVTLPAQS